MNVNNIGYYKSLWDKYDHFSKNNETRKQNAGYLNPEYLLINPIATVITEATSGAAKWGYTHFGLVVVKTIGLFNSHLGNKAKELWLDPISTETVLVVGTTIEKISYKMAIREPIRFPFLHVLDKIGIAAARHLLIVSKDLNTLLRIPSGLKNYLTTQTTGYQDDTDSPSLINRGWQYIKIGTSKVSDAILDLISLIMKAVENFPLADLVIKKTQVHLSLLKEKVHTYLLSAAFRVIDKGEAKARRMVVAKVADESLRQSTHFLVSSGLKLGLGALTYYIAKQGFTQISGYEEISGQAYEVGAVALKVIGAALWVRCITPTLIDLHKDYKKDFDPSKSLLSIFQN